MEPFDSLTRYGRLRRLRQMGLEALTHYDIEVARLSILSTSFNTIYRLQATDGKMYVLRINYPNERTPIDILSEMTWLDALSRETDIPVITPIKTRNGNLLVTVETDGVPEPRHCAVFEWIDGRTMSRPSLNTIGKIGAAMAQLQNHADTFKPPTPFSEIKYNKAWTFGTPERIYDNNQDPNFTPKRRAILRQAIDTIQEYLNSLYENKDGLRFLHADMHAWNIKIHHERLYVLDFDDSMWCYPVQDIGISLHYLERKEVETAVRDAFKKGYTAHRAWPERFPGEIDICKAHRAIDLISLLVEEEKNPEFANVLNRFLSGCIPDLERWLKTIH